MKPIEYILALLVALCLAGPAHAGDPTGKYASVDQATRDWVKGLTPGNQVSGKTPCCALEDGQILNDTQWDYCKDVYCVYLVPPDGKLWTDGKPGRWIDVPPDTVIQLNVGEVNLTAHALVWPYWNYDANGQVEGAGIRCFLPGTSG